MEELIGTVMMAGEAEGEIMFSDEPLSFWGGYDQSTGEIIDRRHPLSGQNACNKILAIPSSRGSTTTVSVLLEAMLAKKSPAALLVEKIDPYFALAAVIASEVFQQALPVVQLSGVDFTRLKNLKRLQVSGEGVIRQM